MTQKIYPDAYGLAAWDVSRRTSFHVRIVNGAEWRALTGEPAPPTPVDAAAYTKAGLPWFALYDEERLARQRLFAPPGDERLGDFLVLRVAPLNVPDLDVDAIRISRFGH